MPGGGGGSSNFHVNFDGSGGPGGGGFERMFNMGGSMGGQQQGRNRQKAPPAELFPKNSSTGIAPLGKSKFPNASSKFA